MSNTLFTTRMAKSTVDEKSIKICRNHIDLRSSYYSNSIHWHDFFELEMVIEGHAIHVLNGVSYPVSPGSLYMLTPADLHTLIPDPSAEDSKLTIINLNFLDSVFPETSFVDVQTLPSPLIAQAEGRNFEDFLSIERCISTIRKEKGAHADEILFHLCFSFIFNFIRLYHAQHDLDETKGQKMHIDKESANIRNAIAYIRYNFRDPNISTISISKAICLSPNYFGTLFKKHIGDTCMSYIKTQRMNFAKVLLSSSSLTVSEIAEKCGYSSTPYFISDFHSTFGIPPKRFRNLQDQQNN